MTKSNDELFTKIRVDFNTSPRRVIVNEELSEISIVELYSAMKLWEETGMTHDHLCDIYGGTDLGGGLKVGRTLELRNVDVIFSGKITGGNVVNYNSDYDDCDVWTLSTYGVRIA